MPGAASAHRGGKPNLSSRPKDIGRDAVRRLLRRGATLVEVLPHEEYEAEHIAGARNIPLKSLDRAAVTDFDRDRPVIVYCHDFL